MQPKILVVYGSRAGSTAEIAEVVGDVLRQAGAVVDVRPLQLAHDLRSYQSVVIGSAVRHGRLLNETIRFAWDHEKVLRERTTAYFVACITLKKDTMENRGIASDFLNPLREIKEPVSVGLFAGKIDRTKVEPLWRFLLGFVKDGNFVDSDCRDWGVIRAWALSLVPLLVNADSLKEQVQR